MQVDELGRAVGVLSGSLGGILQTAPRSDLQAVIKALKSIGVDEHWGEIDISHLTCSTEELPLVLQSRGLSCWAEWLSSTVDRQSTLEIHSVIEAQSHINFDHVLCIVVASGIAAVGLLSDSTAYILAAFFISPMMSMVSAQLLCTC